MAVNPKTAYVVDASFVLAFLMPDETSLEADSFFKQFKDGQIDLISSQLLPYEVINGFKTAFISKRVKLDYCKDRIQEFLDYKIETREVDFMEVFLLAKKNNLTVYDATYLYLAIKNHYFLLTLDQKLTKFV